MKLNKRKYLLLLPFCFSLFTVTAQNDTMYIMKAGVVINKQSIRIADVDSIIFYNPNLKNSASYVETVLIPSGTFTMGSPVDEVNHNSDEIEHQVTLSSFRMSKYEVTNAQYASFLNAKSIGSDSKYASGAYPDKALIHASGTIFDWGLHYNNNKWEPVAGYENNPVIDVTWYGATEFATYIGGTLPTEAQWEYACRGNTTTAFNTGACLSNTQANYDWKSPLTGCTNTNTTYPGTTQSIGTYPANAFGLYDMHGNAWEWCADWYGPYTTTPQINPTGPSSGSERVYRGGGNCTEANSCRSGTRVRLDPDDPDINVIGFRVVLVP